MSKQGKRKRLRTHADLDAQFREQWELLRAATDGYDVGRVPEAKNIAMRLRVLLHHRGSSHSLLKQLGMGDILFFDTSDDPLPGNLLPHFGLVGIRMSARGVRFEPPDPSAPLSHPVWLLSFEQWWERPVISIPAQFEFTRRTLVLTMANQDGGGHVDPDIDEDYYRLTRENALGFTAQLQDGSTVPVELAAQASIRQIAQEVLGSLLAGLREIPRDLPDEPGPQVRQVVVDAATGTRTERWVTPRNVCPCKSGLPYSECHGKPASD